MSLEELLVALGAGGVRVEVGPDGAAVLRGPRAAVTADLREAVSSHREALVRLHRPAAPVAWRGALARAEPWRRAAWAELAASYEASGVWRGAAEYLAWDEVAGWE